MKVMPKPISQAPFVTSECVDAMVNLFLGNFQDNQNLSHVDQQKCNEKPFKALQSAAENRENRESTSSLLNCN